MEANTFITRWEYRYEFNMNLGELNELGAQGWELLQVSETASMEKRYLFKRMVLEEWNLDGYKAAAIKPTKQGEPASIDPFDIKEGEYYVCIHNFIGGFKQGNIYQTNGSGITLKAVLRFIESIACDNMGWISVNEQLPEVGADGESEYVLACNCRTRAIPSIVKYSDGRYSRKGWWLRTFCHLSMNVKRSSKEFGTNLRFTHWAKIELPKED